VIAILGAESTGKTKLARDLAHALAANGHRVGMVAEYLREFCAHEHRTPRKEEQRHVADEQTSRIDEAAAKHEIVVADTTALQIAVYSELVFGDVSLYPSADAAHRRSDLTLLTALDVPWQPDGLQRDGAHVREPVDALLRHALQRTGSAYSVIAGHGADRLAGAVAAARHALGQCAKADRTDADARWHWVCDRCGDADCERHLLPKV
jgi:nicotinamide riboside kinase